MFREKFEEVKVKKYNNILLSTRKYKTQRDYWINYLLDLDVERLFHTNDIGKSSPTIPDSRSKIEFIVPPEISDKLIKLSKNSNAALYVLILSAYIIFLHKFTGKHDIFVGCPVYHEIENLRLLNDVTVMRKIIPGNESCKDVLMEVKEKFIEACQNQAYPFDKVIEELCYITGQSYDLLFDQVVACENIHHIDITSINNRNNNLLISFLRKETGIRFKIQFNEQVYNGTEIETIKKYFNRMLGCFVDSLPLKVSELEILSRDEKQEIVYKFNDTKSGYPGDRTIHQLFERQVNRTPDNIALTFVGKEVTYRELNTGANRLARFLWKKNVDPNHIVGIMVEHSIEMLVGVMGILKAGAAYLPIDPAAPSGRVKYILEDSNISILCTQKQLAHQVTFAGEIIDLDSVDNFYAVESPGLTGKANHDTSLTRGRTKLIKSFCGGSRGAVFTKRAPLVAEGKSNFTAAAPADLAYVIYTSGSTGRPKGTMIEHQSLVNYIWAAKQLYIESEDDVFALYSVLAFDFTVTSIFTPLVSGNRVIVYHDNGTEFILHKIMRENQTTILKLTPAHLMILKDMNNRDTKIKRLIVGGEDLKVKAAEEVYKSFEGKIDIYNEYGPTETVVGCMIHKYDPGRDRDVSVPIGVPMNNVQIYLLDNKLHLLPKGSPGEIYISGDGVARGYLNNPGLTKQRFIQNPFIKGERMYKTGDLSQFLATDRLVFLGRKDQQVTIRGFRIEPGEIENQLLNHGEITGAVVLDRVENGNEYLCAYIVSNGELTSKELEEYLKKELPDYMIPLYFVKIEQIPLTPNGKLDRKVLEALEVKKERNYTPPGNDLEKKLAEIWAKILEIDEMKIGITDNFFQLGGHSLRVTQLAAKIHSQWNISLPLTLFFQKATIAELAEELKKQERFNYQSVDKCMVILKQGNRQASHFFFIHGGCGSTDVYLKLVENLAPGFNYWGIKFKGPKNYAPQKMAVRDIAAEYIDKIKKIQPKGPYRLAGWSAGGAIAFEIVRQLEQIHEEIAFCALIDSYIPEGAIEREKQEFYPLEAEKRMVQPLFEAQEINFDITGVSTLGELWTQLMNILEKSNMDPDKIMKLIPEAYRQSMPDYLDIKDIIVHINTMRTHEYMQNNYKPGNRIFAKIHYFSANETRMNKHVWELYTSGGIKYYDIEGDHYSILKLPLVKELSGVFAEAISAA